MSHSIDNTSRRSFIRNSGVALTAAIAGAGATATPLDAAAQRLALLEDSNAIRALQQRCFTLLEQGKAQELRLLFSDSAALGNSEYPPLQLDSRLDAADIEVARDRHSARARFRGRVQLGAAISGNGTAQQMARLQGLNQTQWWEQGEYEAQYVKVQDAWKLSALHYRKA